jgi:hypothetical protein
VWTEPTYTSTKAKLDVGLPTIRRGTGGLARARTSFWHWLEDASGVKVDEDDLEVRCHLKQFRRTYPGFLATQSTLHRNSGVLAPRIPVWRLPSRGNGATRGTLTSSGTVRINYIAIVNAKKANVCPTKIEGRASNKTRALRRTKPVQDIYWQLPDQTQGVLKLKPSTVCWCWEDSPECCKRSNRSPFKPSNRRLGPKNRNTSKLNWSKLRWQAKAKFTRALGGSEHREWITSRSRSGKRKWLRS